MKNWNLLHADAINCLKEKLPPFLIYHQWEHTKQVMQVAELIALQENITNNEMILLKTAALLHDSGFITNLNEGHEEASVLIAEKKLPNYGYNKQEIDLIAGMIRATTLPQNPKTKLECILADADLDYLGTENYEHIRNKLYLELKHYNPELKLAEWNEIQINFLRSHSYHTPYCIKNRAPIKEKNLTKLIQTVDALKNK